MEEFTAKASAEDELLGHMRSVVDGMALGARKTDYTSFQSEYAISNTGLTAAGDPTNHRERIVHTMLAMEWLAQSMGEIYRPHPDYSTFISIPRHPNGEGDELRSARKPLFPDGHRAEWTKG